MPYPPTQYLMPGASRVLQGALGGLQQTGPYNRTQALAQADLGQNFDPSMDIRNPYYLDLMKQQRAAGLPDPWAETGGQQQQRAQVAATTKQQAEDYDLETYAPTRAAQVGAITRDEARRTAQSKARTFFDPTVTRQRESEQEAGLKEFETRYVQPKVAEAQGRAEQERLRSEGLLKRAELEARNLYDIATKKGDVTLAQEAMKAFARVAAERAVMDPGAAESAQGQLANLMPTANYGQQTEDFAQAADQIARAYPGRSYDQLVALIPTMFEAGQISDEELWLLKDELRRRMGVTPRNPPPAPPTPADEAPRDPRTNVSSWIGG